MAEDNIDDILVRIDEIEKLQAELRHLVPRVENNSSIHARQDLSRDSSASIRFPSLFTFPVISNFASSPKTERVQKSAAQLNLRNKLASGNRSAITNSKNVGGLPKRESSTKEANIFRNLLKSTNNVAKSYGKNSLASTSVANSKTSMTTPMRNVNATRMTKNSQEVNKKGVKIEMSKTATRDKTLRATNGEKSNMRIFKNENANSIRSSVQTSDIQIYAGRTSKSGKLRRNPDRKRTGISMKMIIERIMGKFNYYFIDNERVTVPYNYPVYDTQKSVDITCTNN